MEKKTYEVTEQAGGQINGRRLAPDEATVDLTEDEARYELMLGNLRLPGTRAIGEKRPDEKPAAEPEAPAAAKRSKRA